jgi:hypothetical protein
MNVYQYILIALIIFLGLKTSYEDFRFGKIRNFWILFGIIASFLVTATEIIAAMQGKPLVISNYLALYGYNFLIALGVGYLLWNFGLVSAGIAKLFMMYAVLVPLSTYDTVYISVFPSSALLVNTFIIACVYLFLEFCFFWLHVALSRDFRYSVRMDYQPYEGKDGFSFSEFATTFIVLFSFLQIMHVIRTFLYGKLQASHPDWLILSIVLVVLLRRYLVRISKKGVFLAVSIVLALLAMSFNFTHSGKNMLAWTTIDALIIAALFMIFRRVIFKKGLDIFISHKSRIKIPLESFNKNMQPVKRFIERFAQKLGGEEEVSIMSMDLENLSDEQVEYLKDLLEKNGKGGMPIVKNSSVAVWFFVGAVLTMLIHGPLVDKLLEMWR